MAGSRVLATGTGSIQSRLLSAGLELVTLEPGDFEQTDDWITFTSIRNTLGTNEPVGYERSFAATRMSDDQAAAAADAILRLFSRIDAYSGTCYSPASHLPIK